MSTTSKAMQNKTHLPAVSPKIPLQPSPSNKSPRANKDAGIKLPKLEKNIANSPVFKQSAGGGPMNSTTNMKTKLQPLHDKSKVPLDKEASTAASAGGGITMVEQTSVDIKISDTIVEGNITNENSVVVISDTVLEPIQSVTNDVQSNENLKAVNILESSSLTEEAYIGDDGEVTLIYEQYNEKFPIIGGSTTAINIDEIYCLTYVMPECLIHLSHLNPIEKRELEISQGNIDNVYMKEDPIGTYHRLEANKIYYVYIEQKSEQLARDQEETRKKLVGVLENVQKDEYGNILNIKGQVLESCSCLYGNPCVDDSCCEDWENRFAIATKNGWKGF